MAPAQHCSGCPYRDLGPAIGPRGNPASRIVIVGEAPGAKEIIAGRPFEGRAGDVLWEALDAAQLRERDLFITNSVACQPHPTKPTVKAIDACRGRLVHEIEAYPRAVIVALGGTAVRALTGQRGFRVLRDRSQVLTTRWGPVVPTFHPARVLRDPAERPLLVKDLKRARRLAVGPDN
jgi:uracil-DNA glycosylase